MQAIEIYAEKPPVSPISIELAEQSQLTAIHMRALRRKARRISAYARFNVEALNALAVEVELDLAALRH